MAAITSPIPSALPDSDPASALLDAYSQAVIRVVERVTPAVAHVRRGPGGGSGLVIAPDGYVLTNAHVVDGATEVEVAFAEGATYRAPVVGTDAATDLALVRVLGPSRTLSRPTLRSIPVTLAAHWSTRTARSSA